MQNIIENKEDSPTYIIFTDQTITCVSRSEAEIIYRKWQAFIAQTSTNKVDAAIQTPEFGTRKISEVKMVMNQTQYDNYIKQKSGQWKCKHGRWHKKGEECYCASLLASKENSKIYLTQTEKQEPEVECDIPENELEKLRIKYPYFTKNQLKKMAKHLMRLYEKVPSLKGENLPPKTDNTQVTIETRERNIKASVKKVQKKLGAGYLYGYDYNSVSVLQKGKSIASFRLDNQGFLVDFEDVDKAK